MYSKLNPRACELAVFQRQCASGCVGVRRARGVGGYPRFYFDVEVQLAPHPPERVEDGKPPFRGAGLVFCGAGFVDAHQQRAQVHVHQAHLYALGVYGSRVTVRGCTAYGSRVSAVRLKPYGTALELWVGGAWRGGPHAVSFLRRLPLYRVVARVHVAVHDAKLDGLGLQRGVVHFKPKELVPGRRQRLVRHLRAGLGRAWGRFRKCLCTLATLASSCGQR